MKNRLFPFLFLYRKLKMKILIVEDNHAMLKMLKSILEKEKFIVDLAEDGEVAFSKGKNNKYDLILLDLMLPKKSGFEVIKGLRACKILTPILVVSAMMNVEDRVTAINLGADDYLVKNFAVSELVARIKGLIRRSNNKEQNILTCGNLVFNLSHNSLMREQKNISLTKIEFRILLKLILNKNKMIPIDELVESVWGEDKNQVISNKLSVHIRSLRQKIGKDMIVNQRDFGYMLTDCIACL